MRTCETCGKEWPEDYCPECAHSIGQAARSAVPPPLPSPNPSGLRGNKRQIKHVVLLTSVALLACTIPTILIWKRGQHDDDWPTVLDLRKKIRAAVEGTNQGPLQKSLKVGDGLAANLANHAEKTYGPLGKTADE